MTTPKPVRPGGIGHPRDRAGRVAIYRLAAVRGSDQEWMTVIAPATLAQTEAGIKAVLSSLNIRNWAEHTRF